MKPESTRTTTGSFTVVPGGVGTASSARLMADKVEPASRDPETLQRRRFGDTRLSLDRQLDQPSLRIGHLKQRSAIVPSQPVEQRLGIRVELDADRAIPQQPTIRLAEDDPAPRGDHCTVRSGTLDDFTEQSLLGVAKRLFALALEEGRDRLTDPPLEERIAIGERDIQVLRQPPTYRALADARKSDQADDHGIRSVRHVAGVDAERADRPGGRNGRAGEVRGQASDDRTPARSKTRFPTRRLRRQAYLHPGHVAFGVEQGDRRPACRIRFGRCRSRPHSASAPW